MEPAQTFRPSMETTMKSLPEWSPVLLGMALLFIPTLYSAFTGLWTTEEQAHGPVILFLSAWLMFRRWPEMLDKSRNARSSASGWFILVVGLLFYVLGRSQQIMALELLSLVMVVLGVLLIKCGVAAVKVQWFAFFFVLFMIPLPGPLVSMLTLPMKMAVSWATEHILFALDYPIARSGVILQIGQYQLLVADACAGLQTLLTLEALGLFYLNVVRHSSPVRNITLAILIVPISFTANVIRVIVLSLVTYYLGDAAGQGFLHGFAGMVLFVTALLLILSVDSALHLFVKWRQPSIATQPGQ